MEDPLLNRVRHSIKNNDTEKAIKELDASFTQSRSSEKQKTLALIAGNYYSLKEKQTKGVIDQKSAQTALNQIHDRLLNLADNNYSKSRNKLKKTRSIFTIFIVILLLIMPLYTLFVSDNFHPINKSNVDINLKIDDEPRSHKTIPSDENSIDTITFRNKDLSARAIQNFEKNEDNHQIKKQTNRKYNLNILTNPSGASIWLAGKFVGKSNTAIELPQGEHLIKIEKKGYLADSTILLIPNRHFYTTTLTPDED